ncbi:MAG: 23S rRNA (adenine(2030)-N(6))-methyltransferase RlmJ [Proteobacteria bacterium]|nr:23S rRNA (adenine(2030)-N(6))-methyltransferase RlmJ [Pseudomonadota bacterium]
MNYRHIFHAGNFADVLKHAVLARILTHLNAKPAPYRVIDTHAGIGVYDLTTPAAQRNPEWKDGIGRLLTGTLPPEIAALLAPYLDIVAPMMAADRPSYPGSPRIIQNLSRTQDRLSFIEKHPADAEQLKAACAGDRRVSALAFDGWTALNAQVPPPEKRGLVLIDPPFEEPGEFTRMAEALARAHRKWATGIYMLWFPVKPGPGTRDFLAALAATGIPRILRLELVIESPRENAPLSATGLVIVNPPWTLESEMRTLLPFLTRRLARGTGQHGFVECIASE